MGHVDLKANGEVSRMRSHKGNMPSLPQTKYCPLCPAKFTRTTHLNRHLRSHTNERQHKCNICGAEFTRSDLLTRHKRTCGDSRNANRSRRKSCQACAESKVKCNLQYPCSKCTSRGRECIFINDPEASRMKRNAARKSSQCSSSPSSSNDAVSTSPSPSLHAADSDGRSAHSYSSPCLASSSSSSSPALSVNTALSASQFAKLRFMGPPSLSNSSASTPPSSLGSPRTEYFESSSGAITSFDLGFDTLALDTQLGRLFPSGPLFEQFGDDTLSPCSPESGLQGELPSWSDATSDQYSEYSTEDPFSFSTRAVLFDDQELATGFQTMSSPASVTSSQPSHRFSVVSFPGYDDYVQSGTHSPGSDELDQYLYFFFSAFSSQIPLLHHSTWRMDGKPPILIRVMQACGALFVKTPSAIRFVNETLLCAQDILVVELAKSASDMSDQINLMIAIVLLQTIGLFHQRSDPQQARMYHGLLVMTVRRTGLLERVGSWKPSDLTDPNSLEADWKDWAQYETIKRTLLLAYLQDCSHCMYFSMPPSFQSSEFDINLPCDEALWIAGNARDWYQALQTPSPYGVGPARSAGVSMQLALDVLADTRPSAIIVPLNPFAHFILIHTILRNIHAHTIVGTSAGNSCMPKQSLYALQFALHNWLRMWTNSPEASRYEEMGSEPPFVYNVLPFYWLAQAVITDQEGTATLGLPTMSEDGLSRYLVLKEWLGHIRTRLRVEASPVPTQLWNELQKIRLRISQGGQDPSDSLFSFLPIA
ncbi:fungal-specific transcription factor domain-containing protein [Cyathus striatus]|nr:fungal-specific transcription factor domain-containing protein [Cyathus striatus]